MKIRYGVLGCTIASVCLATLGAAEPDFKTADFKSLEQSYSSQIRPLVNGDVIQIGTVQLKLKLQ